MTDPHTLDDTINKAAFWSAIVLILAGVLSVFFLSVRIVLWWGVSLCQVVDGEGVFCLGMFVFQFCVMLSLGVCHTPSYLNIV